jgi:hypothetical protein
MYFYSIFHIPLFALNKRAWTEDRCRLIRLRNQKCKWNRVPFTTFTLLWQLPKAHIHILVLYKFIYVIALFCSLSDEKACQAAKDVAALQILKFPAYVPSDAFSSPANARWYSYGCQATVFIAAEQSMCFTDCPSSTCDLSMINIWVSLTSNSCWEAYYINVAIFWSRC